MAEDARSRMSAYERDAWDSLVGEADKQGHLSDRFGTWTRGIKSRIGAVAAGARGTVERIPGAGAALDAADAAVTAALGTLHTTLVERGLHSVAPETVLSLFGAGVRSYADVRTLDLAVCDRSLPQRRDRYVGLAATEGVVSSLAVTGAELSAAVSAGTTLTIAGAAIAADVTTVLAGMGRIIALVGAHYGYDVRETDEQVFAAGVLAYSAAGGSTETAAALAALSRLTQQMMRQTTWRRLQQRQLVDTVQKVVTALGVNLAKHKLAQAIPVLGAAINGGVNARIAYKTFDRTQHAYRLRFLTEKYGMDPARWAPRTADDTADGPLVDEILNAELAADPDRA